MQNKKVNFSNKETELKMENFTRTFGETNLVLQAQARIADQKSNFEAREKKKSAFFSVTITIREYCHSLIASL